MDEALAPFITFPPFIIAMVVTGATGEMIQKVVAAKGGDKGWKGLFYITKSYHPIFILAVAWSFPQLPMPDGAPADTMSRIFAGAGCGAVSMIGYELTVKTIRKVIVTFGDNLGGVFDSWSKKLGGSSNTPTRRTTEDPPAQD